VVEAGIVRRPQELDGVGFGAAEMDGAEGTDAFGRSAGTPEPLLCRAWNLAARTVCGAATVFTDFIMPRRSASAVRELYAVEVSPDLISRVTDAVLEEVRDWQNRPLDTVYPVVFFDALRVKIRDESVVRNKAVYLALALDCEGHKHVLGLWIEQSEGAKFWLRVMNELKNRGVDDFLFAVVDGLKGFPDAITAVFPRTIVQTSIVHLIRNSLLRAIYRAETAEVAELRLADFEAEWGKKYPAIAPAWRRVWNEVVPFFAYPPQIRKMIYTTNAIESLHRGLRKIIKTRGAFPSDEAATKLLYLALRNLGVHWKPAIEWRAAYAQFTIFFAERLPTTLR
jgi:putative transposase